MNLRDYTKTKKMYQRKKRPTKIHFWSILIIVSFSVFSYDALADSCRCGNKLVSTGDTKSEVLANCGAPTWAEERTEERIERIHGGDYYDRGVLREPVYGKVRVNIDEWFYNFGPTRFIQIFKFENGKLVAIENGNYGY